MCVKTKAIYILSRKPGNGTYCRGSSGESFHTTILIMMLHNICYNTTNRYLQNMMSHFKKRLLLCYTHTLY